MLIGLVLAFATSVSWALGNVFIQRSGRALGAPRAMLWALGSGGAISWALSPLFDGPFALHGATLWWLLAGGVSGLSAYACLFHAFARARLSLAVPLVSCWSLISGVLSFVVLGERPTAPHVVGGCVVLLGAILVAWGGDAAGEVVGGQAARREQRLALASALGSGISFGVMVPSMAQAAAHVGAFRTSAIVYAVGIVLALPLVLLARIDVRPPPRGTWALVVATGIFETAGFVAVTLAPRHAPMTVVAPVASLAAALTVVYAWVVLRERPPLAARIGAALATGGLVILSR